LKFIEDDFLNARRLDPLTDGRPDPRPTVRENVGILGDLAQDFDFSQTPRPPMLLPVHPVSTLVNRPPWHPTSVTMTPGDGRAVVTWRVPGSNGGSPITGYQVVPMTGGVAAPARLFGSTVRSAIVTGLTNGKTYTFQVSAINQLGSGFVAPMLPGSATIGAPSKPRAVTATAGIGRAVVQWTYPATTNGSPVTGYVIRAQTAGTSPPPMLVGRYVKSMTFGGLVKGKRYTFTVLATNARGTGLGAVTNAVIVK